MLDYHKLLKGGYEIECLPLEFSEDSAVPDFAFSVLNPLGLLYRPVIDEEQVAHGAGKPVWPEDKPFAACLTHDVDAVSVKSVRQSFRTAVNHLYRPSSAVKTAAKVAHFFLNALQILSRSDPLHYYERCLEIEQQVNAHSTFFFWPGWKAIGKRHHTDCSYDLGDSIVFDRQRCSVAEMICEIDRRGWEIGLHPSWYAFNDIDELKRQKLALENVLGHDVVSVRQHCLHYDIRTTPSVHEKAGFKYDSTLGFNDNIGFRFGTCYPWHIYDLTHERELQLLEIPLIIQDVALLNPKKGMRLDTEMAYRYIVQLTDQVERVGGVVTLLWHPGRMLFPNWWELYSKALTFLQDQNAWFAPVKVVGQWWEEPTSR